MRGPGIDYIQTQQGGLRGKPVAGPAAAARGAVRNETGSDVERYPVAMRTTAEQNRNTRRDRKRQRRRHGMRQDASARRLALILRDRDGSARQPR